MKTPNIDGRKKKRKQRRPRVSVNRHINRVLINLCTSGSKEELNKFLNVQKNNLNAINIATAFNRLSKRVSYSVYERDLVWQAIIEKLTHHGIAAHQDFDEINIATTLNAFSKWCFDLEGGIHQGLIDQLVADARKKDNFDEQAISNILNALSKWHLDMSSGFYISLVDHLVDIGKDKNHFDAQIVMNILNALSKWPIPPTYAPLINKLIDHICTCHKFDIAMVSSLLWVSLILPVGDIKRLREHLLANVANCNIEGMVLEEAMQLQQFKLATQERNCFPSGLRRQIDNLLDAYRENKPPSSLFHKQVAEHLKEVLIEPVGESLENEYFCGGYFIDIALFYERQRIAIQVDGPLHFYRNTQTPTRVTQLRDTILNHLGWDGLNIPYYEWYEYKGDQERLQQYLRKQLAKNGFKELTMS